MSNFRKWLTSKEVMKELDISKLDLWELVKNGMLPIYDPAGNQAEVKIEQALSPNVISDWDAFAGPPIQLTPTGINFVDRPRCVRTPDEMERCYFAVNDVEALKKAPKGNKKKSQAKWDNVREWVAAKWKEAPDMTIDDMAISDDVTNLLGKNLTLKTIRDHIKDLCPNRKPGRRPTSK